MGRPHEVSGSGGDVGVVTALYARMRFVRAPVLGAVSDRFGRRPMLLVALAGATGDHIVPAVAPSLRELLIGRARMACRARGTG